MLLVAAWAALALHGLVRLRQERAQRAALGPQVAGLPQPSRALRTAVPAVTLAGAAWLERISGGPLAIHPATALVGLLLVAAGLALHASARQALGARWSGPVRVLANQDLVTSGAYAAVRHPLYLGVLLMAAGTVLAHPSLATGCLGLGLAAGIALKIPAEERVLRAALGEAWIDYAARVPALLPRPSRLIGAFTRPASPR